MKTLLKLKEITKTYPGVVALNKVSLEVQEGEILALVGENGAGKSTLIKIMTGAIEADSGTIEFEDKTYTKLTPTKSRSLGIEAIYQDFNLAPSLTVAENIFLGEKVNRGVLINFKELYKRTEEILENFQVKINPKSTVSNLTVAYMQIVEIARVIARNAKLVIMDEPTAALTEDEVDKLVQMIYQLKSRGVSVIYISHRLEEIYRVADRVIVMRDGEIVTTKKADEVTKEELIYHMVGREMKETYPKREGQYGDIVLEVKNLCGNGVSPISFQLHKGEILGFAGLVGAGRTELARLIFGADKRDGGQIIVEGREIPIKSPKDAVKAGIGFVSEDRKEQGVILGLPIKTNITITVIHSLSKFGIINQNAEMKLVNKYKDSIRIKTPSVNQLVRNLSGGNQQKVALSKWLASQAKILIFDEPTRGIDVGAKQEIYQLMNELSAQGIGIIMISSDMEELLNMTDDLIVFAEGKESGRLEKKAYSQELVLKYASDI